MDFFGGIFGSLDYGWAYAMHSINSGFLNTFFKYFSYLSDKGILILIAAAALMLFKRTRRQGVFIFGAVVLAFAVGLVLKYAVDRPRPFADQSVSDFHIWWTQAGSPSSSNTGSFPSGHTVAAFAFATAFFIAFDKRYSWTGFIFAAVTAVARTYLMVHYFSDVTFGAAVGVVFALIAFPILAAIWRSLANHPENKLADFILNSDVKNLFKKESDAEKSKDVVSDENTGKE